MSKTQSDRSGGGGPTQVTVLLADNRALMRGGVRSTLETQRDVSVVGEVSSADAAVKAAAALRPRVVLVGFDLPGGGAFACLQARAVAGSAVIMATADDWDICLVRAHSAGASGLLVETAEVGELLRLVRCAAAGEPGFTAAQLRRIDAWRADVGRRPARLTPRERAVMDLLAAWCTNADIARCLGIELKTVETHVSHILGKLGVESRRELHSWLISTHAVEKG